MLGFKSELKKYKWWIGVAIIGVALSALADLFLPGLLSKIIDVGIKTGSNDYVKQTGIKMLVITAISLISLSIAIYCTSRIGAGFSSDVRLKIFKKIQSYGPSEMGDIGTASLITRNINDVQQVQIFITMFIRIFVRAPIILVGGIIMAYNESPRLALPLLVSVPSIVLIIFLVFRNVTPKFSMLQSKLDTINRVMREQITGVRVIRAFGTDNHEEDRFDKVSKEHNKLSLSVYRVMQIMSPLLTIVLNVTVMVVLWIGSNDINAGVPIADGALIAVIQYITQILFAFIMMSMVFIVLPRAKTSANRIHEVLDKQILIEDLAKPINTDKNIRGKVEFKNVSFSFPDAEDSALEGISFVSNLGETTAIIGSTGSGKSTILDLIMRFYDVTQGVVLVDGVDVRELSQKELRSKIGFVPQRSYLFSGTIEENIKYGTKDITDETMMEAAKTAQAFEFIDSREERFKSSVSQGGTNFSGGQKQRLSIARAVALDPEIYLFDDSFSALDAETDLKLRLALSEKAKDATQIIVAQRISSIINADQIIVLEHGCIVGKGTHHELIKTCDIYKEIAVSQYSEEEVAM